MKPYDRNQQKGISKEEITKGVVNYRHLTPEETFFRGLNPKEVNPRPLKAIIQSIYELLDSNKMPVLQFYRN